MLVDPNKTGPTVVNPTTTKPATSAPEPATHKTSPTTTTSSETMDISQLDAAQGSVFYKRVLVFLEGILVPEASITISYGLRTPATATLILPSHDILRTIPEDTKLHVFYEDLLPDKSGKYNLNLLFDGELSGFGHSVEPDGSHFTMNFLHAGAYLTMMPLVLLDPATYFNSPGQWIDGAATIAASSNYDGERMMWIDSIVDGSAKGMPDLVYRCLKGALQMNANTGVGKVFHKKIGPGEQGWKLPDRIFGVTESAKSTPITARSYPSHEGGGSGGSGGAGGGGGGSDTVGGSGDPNYEYSGDFIYCDVNDGTINKLARQVKGRVKRLYFHWAGSRYTGPLSELYHITVLGPGGNKPEGTVALATDNFAAVLEHTWQRNTGAIGISMACMYDASDNGSKANFGSEPPTAKMINVMHQIGGILAAELDIPVDIQHVMSHAEAGNNADGWYAHAPYGPGSPKVERWDWWYYPERNTPGAGGEYLRDNVRFYKAQVTPGRALGAFKAPLSLSERTTFLVK